jgi:protein XagA
MAPGRTQVIAKYERTEATQGYDLEAVLVSIDRRRDENLSVFVEHGLTQRLTLQAKAGVTRGHDKWADYSGRGPVELGLRWAAYRDDRSSLAVYVGAGEAGAGRNAGYAAPGQGSLDLEARVLYGRSAHWKGREVFVDLEAARLKPDLWRPGRPQPGPLALDQERAVRRPRGRRLERAGRLA